MSLTVSQRRYVRNMVAYLGGFYGAKGFDLLILASVTRAVPMDQVGTVFFADAIGDTAFRLADFGLFPVLFRRAAREEAGRSLLAWATLARALAVVVLTVPFAAVAMLYFPDRAPLAAAFFVLAGAYVVHEIPRAVLAGRERFATTASIGLVTKILEAGCTVGGLFMGAGVWAWVIGRAVSHLGMLVACYVVAWRDVKSFPSPSGRLAMREGLPFWFAAAVAAGFNQVDTIVVGSYLGLVETAHLGIAGRVVSGALSFVGSMTNVAFPGLVRENRRFATPNQVRVILVVAVGFTLSLIAFAPILVRVVTGHFDPAVSGVLRAMAPVVLFGTLGRALVAWLRAKNKERPMAVLITAAGAVAAAALVVLVPAFGTLGAAFARVFREAVLSLALGALAYVGAHRIHRPLSWLAAQIPGMPRLARARLDGVVARFAERFAEEPKVLGVEVVGSARDAALFRPGESDLDFIVTTDARGESLASVIRHCDRVASRPTLAGPVSVQVLDPSVLAWARRSGHPLLGGFSVRALRGPPNAPPVDPVGRGHWALTHAFSLAVRVQRDAVEDGRHDGATRADRIVKDFRFFLTRLGPPQERIQRLDAEGFCLPEWLAGETKGPTWLSPEVTAEVLRATHHALGSAYAEASRAWVERGASDPMAPEWLARVAERIGARARALAAAFEPVAVHLTPTGPTDDDPMLALVVDEWPRERWLDWVRVAVNDGRLPLPFRAYKWPVALPASVLSADVWVEHAALFHLARRHGGVDLSGGSPKALAPPPEEVRAAAVRETLQALVRIPRDALRVAREPVWQPAELAEPIGHEDPWRFRVRAFTTGRLASLSLLLDHDLALPDLTSVTRAYVERYDDALAAWLRESAERAPGTRVAQLLDEWAAGRMTRLASLLPDRQETRGTETGSP